MDRQTATAGLISPAPYPIHPIPRTLPPYRRFHVEAKAGKAKQGKMEGWTDGSDETDHGRQSATRAPAAIAPAPQSGAPAGRRLTTTLTSRRPFWRPDGHACMNPACCTVDRTRPFLESTGPAMCAVAAAQRRANSGDPADHCIRRGQKRQPSMHVDRVVGVQPASPSSGSSTAGVPAHQPDDGARTLSLSLRCVCLLRLCL